MSTPSLPGPLVHPPQQDRSRQTLDRIVKAALDIIADEGVPGVTVAKVVRRARSSVGSFYARFPGKDDLLRYLEERVWREARERWEAAVRSRSWEDRSLAEVVEDVVDIMIRSYLQDAGRRQALGAWVGRDTSRSVARTFHGAVMADLRRLLLWRRTEIGHPNPELAVDLGYRMLIASLKELVSLEHQLDFGAPVYGSDVLQSELSRLFVSYLVGTEKPASGPVEHALDFVDPFDIWVE